MVKSRLVKACFFFALEEPAGSAALRCVRDSPLLRLSKKLFVLPEISPEPDFRDSLELIRIYNCFNRHFYFI